MVVVEGALATDEMLNLLNPYWMVDELFEWISTLIDLLQIEAVVVVIVLTMNVATPLSRVQWEQSVDFRVERFDLSRREGSRENQITAQIKEVFLNSRWCCHAGNIRLPGGQEQVTAPGWVPARVQPTSHVIWGIVLQVTSLNRCSTSAQSFGNPLDRMNLSRRFKQTIKVLGPDCCSSIHDGRHSFASIALAAGRTLPEVRDALGHRNISTTSVYLHALDDGTVGSIFE